MVYSLYGRKQPSSVLVLIMTSTVKKITEMSMTLCQQSGFIDLRLKEFNNARDVIFTLKEDQCPQMKLLNQNLPI